MMCAEELHDNATQIAERYNLPILYTLFVSVCYTTGFTGYNVVLMLDGEAITCQTGHHPKQVLSAFNAWLEGTYEVKPLVDLGF